MGSNATRGTAFLLDLLPAFTPLYPRLTNEVPFFRAGNVGERARSASYNPHSPPSLPLKRVRE